MKLKIHDVVAFLSGREANSLKISPIRQLGENTCWVACYKMVDEWRGVYQDSCYYVNLQTKNCKKCYRPSATCDKPRPVAKVASDWRNLGYRSTIHYGDSLNENQIRRAIANKYPLQIFLKFKDKATGHYVLIVGMERHIFTADVLLTIIDPAQGYITKTMGQLFQWGHWQDSWRVQ